MAIDVKGVVTSKYLGLPFYAWGAIVVGGVFAWQHFRGKASAVTSAAPADQTTAGGDMTGAELGQPVFQANPVPVSETIPSTLTSTGQPATNDDWSRAAIQWLMTNHSLNAADAQRIVQTYLAGGTLSAADSAHLNAVVGVLGIPPELPSEIPSQQPAPVAVPGPVQQVVHLQGPRLSAKYISTSKAQLHWSGGSPESLLSLYQVHRNGTTIANLKLGTHDYVVPRPGAYQIVAFPRNQHDPNTVGGFSNVVSV